MTTKSVSLTQPTDYGAESERIARQRRMAEVLQQESMQQGPAGQMVGNTYVPQHWTSSLAKALQGVNARGWQNKSDEDAKALAGRRREDSSADMTAMVRALQGTPASTQPIMDETANGGEGQMAQINSPGVSPLQGLQAAVPNMRTPEMQQFGMQQLMSQLQREQAPPERVDLGNRIGLVKNGAIVGYLPKGATPDAALREQGSNQRHLTPSGSAVLQEQGSNQRHLTPSGSAQLSARTTLQTHGTPSGSAVLADTRAREALEQGKWTNDLDRGLQINTATGETRSIMDGGVRLAPKEKPLTESQAKASVFHSQMAGASQELASIPGYDPNSGVTQAETAVAGGRGNMIANESAQRAKQAQSQWAESFLRFKTGAASTPAEVALNVATFFPQVGDKPGVVAQKARMREQAEKDISIAAGRSAAATPQRRASDALSKNEEAELARLRAQVGGRR